MSATNKHIEDTEQLTGYGFHTLAPAVKAQARSALALERIATALERIATSNEQRDAADGYAYALNLLDSRRRAADANDETMQP